MNKKYSKNHDIEVESIKLIYKSLAPSQVGMFLAALVLMLLLRDHVSLSAITTWFSLIIVTIIYRLLAMKSFKQVKDNSFIDVEHWKKIFLFGVLLSAFSWGTAGVILFPQNSLPEQAFIIITLTGVISASIGTLAPLLVAIYIFILVAMSPVLIHVLLTSTEYSLSFAVIIVLFIVISLVTASRFCQRIQENIKLKFDSIQKALDLEKSEQKYRLLYEKSEDAMIVFSGKTCTQVNNAAVKLFGYESIEQLIKTPSINLSPVFQPNNVKSFDEAIKIFNTVIKEGHSSIEWICKHKDGHFFTTSVTLTAIPAKNRTDILCVIRDISKQKKIENRLIQAQIKSEEASMAKSDFLANISHEIRTPMNGVIGSTELLLNTQLEEKQKYFAHTIKDSAQSMLTIINDILDYSKIEAGMFDLDNHPFNIIDLLKQINSSFANKVKAKNLKFKLKVDPKMNQWVLGDAGRIRQIFTNLIGNSLKFTKEGSISLIGQIVKEDKKSMYVKFNIIDTGIGISKAKQKQIFERFTQADGSTTRKYGGTGLGLSISRQLSSLMGGEVNFSSKADEGTNFWFTIKLQKTQKPEKIHQKNKNNELPQYSANVLVVEDNQTNQMVAKEILSLYGIKVKIANDGLESIECLKQKNFNLVFMDCHMPVLDGYKATQKIRKYDSKDLNPSTPIIAMTASAMQGDKEKCIAYGMDDYITKPIDIDILGEMLNKWLNPKGGNLQHKTTKSVADDTYKTKANHLVFDDDAFSKRLSGNIVLIKTIAKKFITSMEEQIHTLIQSIDIYDRKQIIAQAHKLKGAAATVGCMELSHLAHCIELAGKENNKSEVNHYSKNLNSSYLKAKFEMEKKLFEGE